MTELHKVQIRFKGKKTFEKFDKIVEYTFAANQTMFWMKKKGTLDEGNSRFDEQMIWYPLSDIAELIIDATRHFETKREVFEYKRDTLKGKVYESK